MGTNKSLTCDGDIIASATGDGAFTLSSDLNGNTTKLPTSSVNDTIEYNWDNKLRSASKGSDSITVKYDPMGNRVYKSSYDGSSTTVQKFIVDIAGKLPTIIAEYSDPNSFTNSYIYADAQILVQYAHSGDPNAADDKYYYVHDRLGSVRMVVDCNTVTETVTAKNTYTYSPFGNPYAGELSETVYNPFQFTGQWYDEEIDQYYLRARMYDPTMMRFTTRDPVRGEYKVPLSLHRYLYCGNDSINRMDLDGRVAFMLGGSLNANVNVNSIFGGEITKSLNGAMGAIMGDTLGQMVAHSMFILPYYVGAVSGFSGSGGLGVVVAKDMREKNFWKGWSIGYAMWGSVGVSGSSGASRSGTVDIGISFNAQHVDHLRGPYGEAGGSFTTGAPFLGPINSLGLTYSRGLREQAELGEHVTMWTGSFGIGTSAGVEAHGHVGYMYADAFWEN